RSHSGHRREQSVSMRERGIGCHDLDQTLVEQLDVGGEPCDTAPRKTLQHRVFQQSGGSLTGLSALSWRRPASISTSCSAAGVVRCAGRVGMMPTNEAIIRRGSGAFLARTPLALANGRGCKGL